MTAPGRQLEKGGDLSPLWCTRPSPTGVDGREGMSGGNESPVRNAAAEGHGHLVLQVSPGVQSGFQPAAPKLPGAGGDVSRGSRGRTGGDGVVPDFLGETGTNGTTNVEPSPLTPIQPILTVNVNAWRSIWDGEWGCKLAEGPLRLVVLSVSILGRKLPWAKPTEPTLTQAEKK